MQAYLRQLILNDVVCDIHVKLCVGVNFVLPLGFKSCKTGVGVANKRKGENKNIYDELLNLTSFMFLKVKTFTFVFYLFFLILR